MKYVYINCRYYLSFQPCPRWKKGLTLQIQSYISTIMIPCESFICHRSQNKKPVLSARYVQEPPVNVILVSATCLLPQKILVRCHDH